MVYTRFQARRAQRDSDDSEDDGDEDEEDEDIEALLDAEEEDEEEMEEEEEESEEDAIERLKTEIGDRYDEETGRVATVQVSTDELISSQCVLCCQRESYPFEECGFFLFLMSINQIEEFFSQK